MTENPGFASSNLAIGSNHASRIPERVVWGLLALGLLLFFFVLPHDIEGDGRLRFDAIQSLLAGGGIPDTKYPLIGSIPSIPLFLLGRVVGSPEWWAHHSGEPTTRPRRKRGMEGIDPMRGYFVSGIPPPASKL